MSVEIRKIIFPEVEVWVGKHESESDSVLGVKKLEREIVRQIILKSAKPGFDCKDGRVRYSGENMYFSVSHKYPYAAVAFSERPTGVDVEKISPKADSVAYRFLSEMEFKLLESFPDRHFAATLFWTLKECAYKISPTNLYSFTNYYPIQALFPEENRAEGAWLKEDGSVGNKVAFRYSLAFPGYVVTAGWEYS